MAGESQTPGGGDRPTERFSEPRPTERFADPRATERFGGAPAPARGDAAPVPGLLMADEVVDGRYRVLDGPIGESSGEAEVYRCADLVGDETVALKLYHEKSAPKESVLQSLLSMRHPDVVALRGHGVWHGRTYEVMDHCAGGSLADHMPFGEAALKGMLREIVRGLQYLHNGGIVHRDIKPSNLFFRDAECRDMVIGDFGVSSMLEPGERVRKTTSAGFFTLDYAAPELIDGKQVGPKTDYYSLGITLLHLLAGRSPFAGMDRNAVLGAHFRGRVPRPENLSPDFARLVNGLLRVRPEARWGHRQVAAWLRGEPVLTDDGLPDRDEVETGRRIPYRSRPEITTPAEMARRTKDFDVCRDLLRGFVSQWVMLFDIRLGREVAALEEEFADNIELGAFKLKYLLDPTLPLEIGDLRLANMAEAVEALARPSVPCREDFVKALQSGCLEIWVAAMGGDRAARALAKRIAELRERVKDPELGLFALLHTLDPARPMAFGPVRLKTPEEIPAALNAGPNLYSRAVGCLFGGWFAEWLRAAFPHREADIAFLEKLAETYTRSDAETAVFALRCHFDPATPLRCGAVLAATPEELAAAIARSPASMEEGARLLSRGMIRLWLTGTGRLTDTAALDEVLADPVASWQRKMEAVLRLLNPDIGGPVVLADADALDAGLLTTEDTKVLELMFFNGGRGHLSGTITLDSESSGFVMGEKPIEGDSVTVKIYLSGQGLEPGSRQEARVVAVTNGGRLEIPLQFTVGRPGWRILGRSVAVGALVGGALGVFRLTLGAMNPAQNRGMMPWPWTLDAADLLPYWGYVPAALLLVLAAGGAAYYAVNVWDMNREDFND
ncbi:MAG: serine/threonine protein kinase [Candidatus Hydrogenedens sp.]|nr:serine/threonine protein kinase [Candidatus Hydrogenedentota bacterium]NLF58667.1 serine/threonine protein kinase [Candidatus Hydrogenedens sp.]